MSYKDLRVIGHDGEIDRLLNQVFISPLRTAYVEIGEDNYCLPIAYANFAESIHSFGVRDDDIYLAAFPRTGSTWSQEMIWLIVNNLDYEGAKKSIGRRFPFLIGRVDILTQDLGIRSPTTTTANGLLESLKQTLEEVQVPIEDCVADAFDGATNLCEPYNGLTAKLSAIVPNHIHTWCYAHVLNIVLSNTAQVLPITISFFGLLQETHVFSKKSLKGNKSTWKKNPVYKLPAIGTTRWRSRSDACTKIFGIFDARRSKVPQSQPVKFQTTFCKELFKQEYVFSNSFQIMEGMSSPRCIKTHLHWSLLPEDITSGKKRPKIIYVLRNPKDTCLSYYHLSRVMGGYSGTFDEFCELFLAGRVPFGPFWKSVLSFWNRKNQVNILFIRYKEMKENLPEVIKKVAAFLGKDLTNVEVEYLAEHLSFENMKRNPAVNLEKFLGQFANSTNIILSTEDTFIRSGKQGGYASVMSNKLIDRFNTWTKENLDGTCLEVE